MFVCTECGKSANIELSDLPFLCGCGARHFPDGTVQKRRERVTPRTRSVEQPTPIVVLECPHRGAELRRVGCPTCRGNVQVKVYSCAKFGECTIGKAVAGVHVCDATEAVPRSGNS